MTNQHPQDLHVVTARLIEPALTGLAHDLRSARTLGSSERQSVVDGLALGLRERVLGRVARVLLLELHAARLSGRLTAPSSAGRWDEWLTQASHPDYWDSLTGRYPTLVNRLDTMIGNLCRAGSLMARRFSADRAELAKLCGDEPELTGFTIGAGDSHQGGQTVAVLDLTHGRVLYKPRPLQVDVALSQVLRDLLADEPAETRIRVPEVIARTGYGWAEHVEHRYCANDDELRLFYRGLGHWLAVTRLLAASDLHAENLIAVGPVPVVVDCETLFTPHTPKSPSGYGAAPDHAADLVSNSLLRTGLLPGRGFRLGLRGADISAAGALPDQQPTVAATTIVGMGTDQARLALEQIPRPATRNLPSPVSLVGAHWSDVVDGFDELNARLVSLDRRGRLESILATFDSCPVRVVLRDTAIYAELGAMLWHPSALHDEAGARARVGELLAGNATNAPAAPSDPTAIEAEIRSLLVGDVPAFTTDPARGVLTGPDGIVVGTAVDLPKTALTRWRATDPALDRQIIECAVISAYRDETEQISAQHRLIPTRPTGADLDRRRRTVAARILAAAAETAIRGDDGTVTWIAPIMGPTGPTIQPLGLDTYNGLPGVAMILAAYQREVTAGRADEVPGTDNLFAATLHTLRVIEEQAEADRDSDLAIRPEPPGGYLGLGSRIWSWLRLGQLGAVPPEEARRRATALAWQIPASVAADDIHDVLTGMAGAIVPLLHLAHLTGEQRWHAEAVAIGDRLAEVALLTEGRARWPGQRSADGLGGFAHGSLGIGWALARLARETGHTRFAQLAGAAFAFQESLYDPGRAGWRDPRKPDGIASNWCYGCDGLGVVAADLADGDAGWLEVLTRSAAAAWADGFGATHTICHGDLGSWEVLDLAVDAGVAPVGVTRDRLDAQIVSSMLEYGPRCAMTNTMFRPGLMSGTGGMAYQLLRMHPDSALPTVMLPDPAIGNRG